MINKLGELKINKSADYFNKVAKALEEAGFVLVLDYETTTDRYFIIASNDDKGDE